MGIRGEIGKAGKDLADLPVKAGKETWNSKGAGELLGNVLMVQPAKMALGIFGISMRTSLKISGILALRGAAALGKTAMALPMFATGGVNPFKPQSDYNQMARESRISFETPSGQTA